MTARRGMQAATDGDFLWLCGCILLLCAASMMLAREVRAHDDDIRFLMDNAVTRETESRP